jgi:hypothetical protein
VNDGPTRVFGYVGPPELRATVRPDSEGRIIRSAAGLDAWLSGRGPAETTEPFTFVVALDGLLRLAPRRSERGPRGRHGGTGCRRDGIHGGRWTVHKVTNHSVEWNAGP